MRTIWLIKISGPLALFEQVGFGYTGFRQVGPTLHAADASPRSVSTLFFARSVFPVSAADPRSNPPLKPAVGLHFT
jgi:hypothetical protein